MMFVCESEGVLFRRGTGDGGEGTQGFSPPPPPSV